MKRSYFLFTLYLFVVFLFNNCKQQNELILEGPYLGQTPPGLTPELFAPNIVSTGLNEIGSSFSNDGKEFFFSIGPNPYMSIIRMNYESDGWSKPEVAPFSGYYDDFDAKFSPDGNRIFFSSSRPKPGKEWNKVDYDIWMVEKKQDGWSEPKNLGNSINSEKPEYCPSLSENGNLYFCSEKESGYGEGDIYVSIYENGEYSEPVNLGSNINGEYFEADPYIAPDESYLIVTCWGRPDTLGKGDLYISFKNSDGSWSELKNMGAAINSVELEHSAWVSNDGKYLFFTSNRKNNLTSPMNYKQYSDLLYKPLNSMNDIYWVDAKIIDGLRPKE
ncbi:MAG: hypothetical protein A2V66_15950 [Ignavibacteria bacterium RBG_13_36_8]|nr:MAG: hypothetical protein A2V66_15950 [Ignavibacteria bacterium RBG_13_36_8]